MVTTIAGLLTFMAEESTTETQTTTGKESTTTQTAGGQQAADSTTGADTQAAQTTEGQSQTTETKTTETKIDENSPEFKAALTAAIEKKLPQLQRQARAAVAKELSGGDTKEGEPTVEDLKKQITERDTRLRTFEARDQLESFVADKRNQITVNNIRGVFKLIKDDLKFDDDGNVTNFKEALAAAKLDAPEMFRGAASSIDAGNGARQIAATDMNALIRGR